MTLSKEKKFMAAELAFHEALESLGASFSRSDSLQDVCPVQEPIQESDAIVRPALKHLIDKLDSGNLDSTNTGLIHEYTENINSCLELIQPEHHSLVFSVNQVLDEHRWKFQAIQDVAKLKQDLRNLIQ
jgi:hypothetical protein